MYSYREAFNIFKELHPDINIKFSTFFKYKPKNVLSFTKITKNVCVCTIHSNFESALSAFRKCIDNDELLDCSVRNYAEQFVCSQPNQKCYFNTCEICKDGMLFSINFNFEQLLFPMSWEKWQPSTNKEKFATIEKVKVEGLASDCLNWIIEQRNKYVEHVFIKRNQSKYFKNRIEYASVLNNKTGVIQIDYAENYTCWHQNAPQQANYGYNQISIFTAASWFNDSKPRLTAIVSDYIKHEKESVLSCLDLLFTSIPSSVNEIEIFSDNAASQFKNKFIFHALMELAEKHNKNVVWNFFAAQHGKGVVDGVGAAVKRLASNKVKSQQIEVTCASDFVKACQNSNVNVIEISEDIIKSNSAQYEWPKIFKKSKAMRGIASHHQIKFNGKKIIMNKISN